MTSRRSIRVAAFACVAGLAGVACGGSSGDDAAGPAPSANASADAPTAAADGVPALLQFTAPLVGGGEIAGAELAGKPTAFWFWAPT